MLEIKQIIMIKNSGAEWVINNLRVFNNPKHSESFTRPISKELESVSIIQEIKDKEFNIVRYHSMGQLTITRIE